MRALIYGSCVSRDVFNYNDAPTMTQYFARSSIASAFSKPCLVSIDLDKIESRFQRAMVRNDLTKDFSLNLDAFEYDIILMDFIDERFDLYRMPDDSIITLSGEFFNLGFTIEKSNVIPRGSEEWFKLWTTGWKKLITNLKESNNLDKLYINKVYLSYCTESGKNFLPNYTVNNIKELNDNLEALYKIALLNISEKKFINYKKSDFVGSDNHRWGVSPFHYVDDFYIKTIKAMKNITANNVSRNKNYSNWNCDVFYHDEICESVLADGIHVYKTNNSEIDIYVRGINKVLDTKPDDRLCLFVMSGAVSNRENKEAPFFSGLGLAKICDIPIIAISDPSLALNEKLNLGWYAGNTYQTDLQDSIAEIVEGIATSYKVKPILIGGSGGGFAAAQLAMKLPIPSVALVWNPQTDITQYARQHVENYLRLAFKDDIESTDSLDELESVFERLNIDYKLSHSIKNDTTRIVYLQNKADWHLSKHAKAHLERFSSVDRRSENSFRLSFINFVIGNWGNGHAAPPIEEIANAVEYIKNECIDELCLKYSDGCEATAWNEVDNKNFLPYVLDENGYIKIEVFDDTFSPAPDPEFSIYLFKNRELVFEGSYQYSRMFDVGNIVFDSIRVFIKDSFGVVSAKSFYEYNIHKPERVSECSSELIYFPQDFPKKSFIEFIDEYKLNIPVSNHGEMLSLDTRADFDWKLEFDTNLNNNRMWLYSLDFIGRLLSYYEYSNDHRALLFSRHFLNSFIRFSRESGNKEFISGIPSRDHSTTFRLNAILKYLSIAGRMIPKFERDIIVSEVIYWADWLYSPDYFHETNHGTMSSIALMVVSCFFNNCQELKNKYFKKATNRLSAIANKSLCVDGLCYENTIGYHNFNLNLYKKSIQFSKRHGLWDKDLDVLNDLVKKAEVALSYAIRQDCTIPPIGDSPVYKVNYNSINKSKCFKQSGFAVIKDEDTYLSVQCGSRSEHHKQMDDSSLTYRVSGKDIIIDAGSYTYDRQNGLGRFVESACGHSGIFPRSFDNKRRKEVYYEKKGIYGEIRGLYEFDSLSLIDCAYHTGDQSFFAERKVFSTIEQDLIITDTACLTDINSTDQIVSRYNIGSDFKVICKSNGSFSLEDGESILNMFLLCNSSSDLFFSHDEGGKFKGWHSVDFGVIKKNFTIELISSKRVAEFLVVFTKKDLCSFRQSVSKYRNLFPASLNFVLDSGGSGLVTAQNL